MIDPIEQSNFLKKNMSVWQVSSRKLKKYEKEYASIREAQMQTEDPVERLEVNLLQMLCAPGRTLCIILS